jgi:hypothetical protein
VGDPVYVILDVDVYREGCRGMIWKESVGICAIRR